MDKHVHTHKAKGYGKRVDSNMRKRWTDCQSKHKLPDPGTCKHFGSNYPCCTSHRSPHVCNMKESMFKDMFSFITIKGEQGKLIHFRLSHLWNDFREMSQ